MTQKQRQAEFMARELTLHERSELRDRIACNVLPTILAFRANHNTREENARCAYQWADIMLAARME
jgi:aspartate-semialdehyde dehydrogenase